MTYERKYGQREGLADRLRSWANRASNDKSLPWVGVGLIEDLIVAADVLSGTHTPAKPEPEKMEFDL